MFNVFQVFWLTARAQLNHRKVRPTTMLVSGQKVRPPNVHPYHIDAFLTTIDRHTFTSSIKIVPLGHANLNVSPLGSNLIKSHCVNTPPIIRLALLNVAHGGRRPSPDIMPQDAHDGLQINVTAGFSFARGAIRRSRTTILNN